jgi:hypothetical protein
MKLTGNSIVVVVITLFLPLGLLTAADPTPQELASQIKSQNDTIAKLIEANKELQKTVTELSAKVNKPETAATPAPQPGKPGATGATAKASATGSNNKKGAEGALEVEARVTDNSWLTLALSKDEGHANGKNPTLVLGGMKIGFGGQDMTANDQKAKAQ